jgi:hypothetical protein
MLMPGATNRPVKYFGMQELNPLHQKKQTDKTRRKEISADPGNHAEMPHRRARPV